MKKIKLLLAKRWLKEREMPTVMQLENGFVFNDTYYKTLEELHAAMLPSMNKYFNGHEGI